MNVLIAIAVTAAVATPLGAYLHYRYGASVKSAIASIETRVQQDLGKKG